MKAERERRRHAREQQEPSMLDAARLAEERSAHERQSSELGGVLGSATSLEEEMALMKAERTRRHAREQQEPSELDAARMAEAEERPAHERQSPELDAARMVEELG